MLLVRVFGLGVGAAHCPSLSPVSAPFLRNAHHFLPFPQPSPHPVQPSFALRLFLFRSLSFTFYDHFSLLSHSVFTLLSPSISLQCPSSMFVLYFRRLARANTTFRAFADGGKPTCIRTNIESMCSMILFSFSLRFLSQETWNMHAESEKHTEEEKIF